jgi:hypothetical protein
VRFFLILGLVFLLPAARLSACTLWAAAGDSVSGGGTLIAKNRDQNPGQINRPEIISGSGCKFLALAKVNSNGSLEVTAGINERGLCAVASTAGTAAETKTGRAGLMRRILGECKSVDEVIEKKRLFSEIHPCNYLFADKEKILLVEIAPDGKFSMKSEKTGVFCQTNHYVLDDMLDCNAKRPAESSVRRLQRIRELTSAPGRKFQMRDFIFFSHDQNDGPDDSIWRTGSSPKRNRTLASWVAEIPENGPPKVWMRTANSGEKEMTYNITLDKNLWEKGLPAAAVNGAE